MLALAEVHSVCSVDYISILLVNTATQDILNLH